MSVIYKTYEYLEKIKSREVTFSTLINRTLKETKDPDNEDLRYALKAVINHYYFFLWEESKILNVDDKEFNDYFTCVLAFYHYNSKYDVHNIVVAVKEDLDKFNVSISLDDLNNGLTSLNNKKMPLGEKENSLIAKKIALTYSYPEWLVKMMIKHFGIKKIYHAIASSRRSVDLSVNENIMLKKVNINEEVFVKNNFTQNGLFFKSKDRLLDTNEFKTGKVFVEELSMQMMIEKLNPQMFDNTLLVTSDRGTSALDVALRQNDQGKVVFACSDIFNLTSMKKLAEIFNFKSIEYFQSTIDLLLSHVSKENFDNVLIIPESSNIGLIRKKPETLLTLKRDDLDSIIAHIYSSLIEGASFVKGGGQLLFAVYTYDKKESSDLVNKFLNDNTDFTLVEDKQVFASDYPGEGYYYALLRKKAND